MENLMVLVIIVLINFFMVSTKNLIFGELLNEKSYNKNQKFTLKNYTALFSMKFDIFLSTQNIF